MVRNNAQGGNFFFGVSRNMQILFGAVDKRGEKVRFKHVFGILHCHTQPFQTHTRINIVVGQRFKGPVLLAVITFKYNVPNFYKASAITGDITMRIFAALIAKIVINFAARAARTGRAHRPKVVRFAQFKNAFFGHILQPQVVGFFITRSNTAFIDADIQSVRRQAERLG